MITEISNIVTEEMLNRPLLHYIWIQAEWMPSHGHL